MINLWFVSYLQRNGSNAHGDIWVPMNTYINQHPLLWAKAKKAAFEQSIGPEPQPMRITFFYEVPQEIAELL